MAQLSVCLQASCLVLICSTFLRLIKMKSAFIADKTFKLFNYYIYYARWTLIGSMGTINSDRFVGGFTPLSGASQPPSLYSPSPTKK